MPPEAIVLMFWIWTACGVLSYRYFESLFRDLHLAWSLENKACCLLLCLAGPAALICGLAVDLSRPIEAQTPARQPVWAMQGAMATA